VQGAHTTTAAKDKCGWSINRVLRTQISEFQRTDGRKFFNPKDQIWAQAIIGTRDTVILRVCFDPGTGKRVIPGTYVGTVAVDDDSSRSRRWLRCRSLSSIRTSWDR
jgi:hypothetical protein